MTFKRMNEYKRDDYMYESPDGDNYEITIVQMSDRKYVEIKRDGQDDLVSWDVEMLLDIADAVRSAVQKPAVTKTHTLQKPKVLDRRSDNLSPSESIQASVDQALGRMEQTDGVEPVQSFSSEHIQDDVANRLGKSPLSVNPEAKIKKKAR